VTDGCKCHSTALEGAGSDFPNPLAGFEGLLRSREKREEGREGAKMKGIKRT